MVGKLPAAQRVAAPEAVAAYRALAAMLQLVTVDQVERLWAVRKTSLPPSAVEEAVQAEVPAEEALSMVAEAEAVRSIPRMPQQVVALTTAPEAEAEVVDTTVPRSAMRLLVEESQRRHCRQEPAMAAQLATTQAAPVLQGRMLP